MTQHAFDIHVQTTSDRPSGIRLRAVRETPTRHAHHQRHELRASQVDAVARREIEWLHTSPEQPSTARACIEGWIHTLTPKEQQALALRYDPTPWPESLEGEWQEGFALALSLAATQWRTKGHPDAIAEWAASEQLEGAVARHGPEVLRHIEKRAEWDFETALRAYARARGRAPSVLRNR
jgi:hypothetical protein